MIAGPLKALVAATGGRLLTDQAGEAQFTGLSLDSRSLQSGNIFIAIKGEKNAGHGFLASAAERGAAAFVIDADREGIMPPDLRMRALAVDDTRLALRQIALWWRKKFNFRSVAITGTNGKTTTKEMIAELLATKYRVFRTPGNLNNLFGIPLAFCLLDDTCEVGVFELGMSYAGEISVLTRLVEPEVAVITNIGPAHLETMGSLENIARAKFELLENCAAGTVRVLNLDDPFLARRFEIEKPPKIGYAVQAVAQVRPRSFSANSMGRMIFEYEQQSIHLPVPGMHNLYNALAACAVAQIFKIEPSAIKTSLESFQGRSSRMQIISLGHLTIVEDSYNANPTSMKYALQVLTEMRGGGRKLAVLGDMKELGRDEIAWHSEIGRYVAQVNPDFLITVGELAAQIAAQAVHEGYDANKSITCTTVEEALAYLLANCRSNDTILLKASRAMQFEKILAGLKNQMEVER